MEIKIDISDFYMNDGDLESSLKEYVADKVIREIWGLIEKKVDAFCETEIKKQIENEMYSQMKLFIKDFIEAGTVPSPSNSKEQVTIAKYIEEKFKNSHGWGSPDERIREIATKFGNELKQRYDILFASQLVSKLNTNGMLKEDVAKLLLDEKK